MPDTADLKDPENFRFLFNNKVINDVLKLNEAKKLHKNIYDLKEKFLNENYKILCIAFGHPPIKIDF